MSYFCEKQHDISDCAAACLVTIARYHGYHIRVARARELAETDLNGTNIDGIIRAANEIGLEADAVRANEAALFSHITYPCIAHVIINEQLYHYVVIYKITEKNIWIGDPARGVIKMKPEEFFGKTDKAVNGIRYHWTGILVQFRKRSDFVANKSTTKPFFWKLILREKRLLLGALLVSAIYTVLGISGSVYYKILLDSILPSHKKTMLTLVTLGVLLAYLLQAGCNLIRSYFVLKMGKKLEQHLQTTYMEKVLSLRLSFFEKRKAGDLVSRFRDADNVKDAVSSVVITLVIDGVLVFAGLVILAGTNLSMFLWALVLIGGYVGLVFLFNEKFDRYNTMWMEYGGELSSGLIETFKGIETIKAYNMEGQMKKNTKKNLNKLLDCIFHYGKSIYLQGTLQQLFGLIGGVVVLWIGGMHVIDGNMTVGQLILYYSLFQYFSGPIISIVNMQPQMQTAVVAANRIIEILEMEVGTSKETEINEGVEKGAGTVLFDHVSFGYRRNTKNVDDVTLEIQQGEKIAVIGENGSGKSTLFKLLLGFYTADTGKISIGGIPIEQIGTQNIREKIGYVNQETFFFGEKIRDNLKYGNPNATDEKMIEICKLVKAHEFIESQPFGYDTVLQEGGSNLSSGQRQRLAIARALLKEPEILVLDEFTSNIDSETEREIKEILYTCYKEKTIVFITHKIQAFSDCDKVYRMEKGKMERVS